MGNMEQYKSYVDQIKLIEDIEMMVKKIAEGEEDEE